MTKTEQLAHSTTFKDYFTYYGLDQADILLAIKEAVGLTPEDIIYLSGSLIEGIGNKQSDIDAYIISARDLSSLKIGPGIFIQFGGRCIDLEWWTPDKVFELIERLENRPWNHVFDIRDSLAFSHDDLDFLHRLRIGIPLFGEAEFDKLYDRVNSLSLSRLLFDRATSAIPPFQQDLIGLLQDEDFATTMLVCHKFLGFVADILLSGVGVTNPSEKWRLRKISRVDPKLFNSLAGPRLEPDPATYFYKLLSANFASLAEWTEHVYHCVNLANRIIPWALKRIISGEVEKVCLPETVASRPKRKKSHIAEQLPSLGLNTIVRWEQPEVLVQHLETGVQARFNAVTLEVLGWFDGVSTTVDAATSLSKFSGSDLDSALTSVHDLNNVLQHFGMTRI